MAARKVHDLIEQQDALHARAVTFILWPKKWLSYHDSTIRGWRVFRLHKAERRRIPSRSGIYTLLVQPGVARHPACSYLMYVGQAVSLKQRFGQYLNRERRASGRPKIFRLLNVYSNHIWFAFTGAAKTRLDLIEDRLIEAHLPPCNDQLPARIRKVGNAF
jgi:hypothetical protein